MEYEMRTLAVIVVPKGEPIFTEGAITVRIDDEAAGEYLLLEQSTDDGTAVIKINPDEWPTLRDAIDKMQSRCREEAK